VSTLQAAANEDLINAPFANARERFSDAQLFVRVLAPPYPCAGVGALRVVRATPQDGRIDLVVTYADFDRLKAAR
jgi:hypothetical protein